MRTTTFLLGSSLLLTACSKAAPWPPADSGGAFDEADADTDTDTDDDSGAPTQSAFAGLVVINEVMPRPSEDDDWIELFNTTGSTISLAEWGMSDDPDDGNLTLLHEDLVIESGGYVVLEASGDDDDDELGFKLSAEGETLQLLDASGHEVDRIAYPEMEEDQAYARTRDGGETWAVTDDPTEGEANGG